MQGESLPDLSMAVGDPGVEMHLGSRRLVFHGLVVEQDVAQVSRSREVWGLIAPRDKQRDNDSGDR